MQKLTHLCISESRLSKLLFSYLTWIRCRFFVIPSLPLRYPFAIPLLKVFSLFSHRMNCKGRKEEDCRLFHKPMVIGIAGKI